MSTLYLCGAGNSEGVRLALTINRTQQRWESIVLLDDDPAKQGLSLMGVPIAGPMALLSRAGAAHSEVANLVTRTTARRWALRQKIEPYGVPFTSMIHPNVETAGVVIGADTIVYQNAVLGPEVSIGESSVVFMGAVIGHESEVGRCCVVAANSVLNARVVLGDQVYIGSSATIIPEIHVGAGATVGVGSAVIQDVPPGASAIGVPAQILVPSGSRRTPTPELRGAITHVWRETLKLPYVDENENFFDLGGTSLLAFQLANGIQSATGLSLPVISLFRFPTIRQLTAYLASQAPSQVPGLDARAELRRKIRAGW